MSLVVQQAEQATWSSLIQHKQYLVVPINESIVIDDATFLDLVSGIGQRERSTRKAGGQLPPNRGVRPSVVVDMREFNSKLPFQVSLPVELLGLQFYDKRSKSP